MNCVHICPKCKRPYFHTLGSQDICLFMKYRACGCDINQPNLFEEKKHASDTRAVPTPTVD